MHSADAGWLCFLWTSEFLIKYITSGEKMQDLFVNFPNFHALIPF